MRIASAAAAIAGAFLIVPALAQTTPPAPAPVSQRIRGTIDTFDAGTQILTVTTADGRNFSITLAPNPRIIANEKRTLADIKPGDFVASAALRGADGKLHAQEVRIFPEGMRGMGEGQYGMDAPNRSMTNATVAQVSSVSANSGSLDLTYHGSDTAADGACEGHANASGSAGCVGDTEILVAPGIPVMAWFLGDPSWLVPGVEVSLSAMQGPDGVLTTRGLVVERNGVKPIL